CWRPIRRWPAASASSTTTTGPPAPGPCSSSEPHRRENRGRGDAAFSFAPARAMSVANHRADQDSPMKARVTVTLKSGVLDPQGKAIEGGLAALGFSGVEG